MVGRRTLSVRSNLSYYSLSPHRFARGTGEARLVGYLHPTYMLEMIRRLAGIAFLAVERLADLPHSASVGGDPGPQDPGRVMADVLKMPARQLGDPMVLVVLMVAGDTLPHDLRDSPVFR